MNIRKSVDFSAMYAALVKILAQNLPQMEEVCAIGRTVSQRPKKGAAVAAAEYLQANFSDRTGFSPRNLRRMRDFYRTYENDQLLLRLAMKIGWTLNVVIMEAELTKVEREKCLRRAVRDKLSKSELSTMIADAAFADSVVDAQMDLCYNNTYVQRKDWLQTEWRIRRASITVRTIFLNQVWAFEGRIRMNLISSKMLETLVLEQKKKAEGLLPALIKRLINSSCPSISYIRMPEQDDVWAPGFDGIVSVNEGSGYVSSGLSVWEFGTNTDSLDKINADYQKRTENPLGLDKANTAFYLVVPKIWAYRTSITDWEKAHKGEWKAVRIYDASILCDWINTEPPVCAWLFESFYEGTLQGFDSVKHAWKRFSGRTKPSFTHTVFTEGREDQIKEFQKRTELPVCRVKADTQIDAYGFCLSALLQNMNLSEDVTVVYSEDTYRKLTASCKGKTFLLLFPFSGLISDNNKTILCFSREASSLSDAVILPPLWKTQFLKAMCDMGLSNTQAEELYVFSHGNLCSLVRRIPGNTVDFRPQWADISDIYLLCPLVFLRHYHISNEEDRQLIARLADVDYSVVERKYAELLQLEDSPIKKVEDQYIIVNYEEAWMTLKIDITDGASKRLLNEIISLMSCVENVDWYESQKTETRVHQLLKNYIYFAETGSDQAIIDSQITEILSCASRVNCVSILLKGLSIIAEAAPAPTLAFVKSLEKEAIQNGVSSYLSAIDELMEADDTCVQACQILSEACMEDSNASSAKSAREHLLNAFCLWSGQTALSLQEKKKLTAKYVKDNPDWGVPFAIDLIAKESTARGVRFGKKARDRRVESDELDTAYQEIANIILEAAFEHRRLDWLEKMLLQYRKLDYDVLVGAAERFNSSDYSPEALMPLHFWIRNEIFIMKQLQEEEVEYWVEPLTAWSSCTLTDDPVGKVGWMFYEYSSTPFEELRSIPDERFDEISVQAERIRTEQLHALKAVLGMDAMKQLLRYMNDEIQWGTFLSSRVDDNEYLTLAHEAYRLQKMRLLGGFLNAGKLNLATEVYQQLPVDAQDVVLTIISRRDITEWLTTPERKQLFWRSQIMGEFDEQEYQELLKYNPCGLLPYLYRNIRMLPDVIDKVFEVFSAIAQDNKNYNTTLIIHIIRAIDTQYYSEVWAELCYQLFSKGYLSSVYGYVPICLRRFFFENPAAMYYSLLSGENRYGREFLYHFSLPNEAFSDVRWFEKWADFLIERAETDANSIDILGTILGKAPDGSDGIFPHEFVREMLEKYQNSELTYAVARGKIKSFGFRTVQDGSREQKIAREYHENARIVETDYPQTAVILRQLAKRFAFSAKSDRLQSEIEQLL